MNTYSGLKTCNIIVISVIKHLIVHILIFGITFVIERYLDTLIFYITHNTHQAPAHS
jgi:hypothetical protein